MNKTQENLLKAFAGESQARNRYLTFAKMARKEGWEWIARVFEETGDNERAHAEELYEMIKEKVAIKGDLEILPYSTKTVDNLKMAAGGEKHEWTVMYPEFENIAREEGEAEAERLFRELKEVEEKHEERYSILTEKLESGSLYKTEEKAEWKCSNCGYVHKGNTAPEACPVCKKAIGWYEPLGLVR
jgi:rubrerythrin